MLEDRRVIGKHLKKSQKEIVQLKQEATQLKHDKELETKARLLAEKNATTNKGKSPFMKKHEYDSFTAAASKLESLCRELQNQNRSMKNEIVQSSKGEEEKRKQLIEKFQGSLEGITQKLGTTTVYLIQY